MLMEAIVNAPAPEGSECAVQDQGPAEIQKPPPGGDGPENDQAPSESEEEDTEVSDDGCFEGIIQLGTFRISF